MATIENLSNYNWFVVVSAIVVAMIAFKFLSELFDWFVKRFGLQTKGTREKQEMKKLLEETTKLANKTSKGLDALEKQYKSDEQNFHQRLDDHIKESKADRKELHDAVDRLTQVVVDSTTHSMRWEILKFGADLSNGRKYNAEAFNHVLGTYQKYEDILSEHGIKNGLAEETVKFIRDTYQEGLRDGSIK